jgi:hypothetical protein
MGPRTRSALDMTRSLRPLLIALLALALPILLGAAQEPQAPPRVRVPIYPNQACPIMGKPVSMRLTVDTDLGRIWVCCKGCDEEVLLHLEDAHRTAYPVVKKVENAICPVSRKPVPEEEAPRMVLQAFDFQLCCPVCIPKAREDSQVVLARLNEPALEELGNRSCPLTGEAVDLRSFAVIDGIIVRLASSRLLPEVEALPDEVLKRARAIRERELEEERRREEEARKAAEKERDAARG